MAILEDACGAVSVLFGPTLPCTLPKGHAGTHINASVPVSWQRDEPASYGPDDYARAQEAILTARDARERDFAREMCAQRDARDDEQRELAMRHGWDLLEAETWGRLAGAALTPACMVPVEPSMSAEECIERGCSAAERYANDMIARWRARFRPSLDAGVRIHSEAARPAPVSIGGVVSEEAFAAALERARMWPEPPEDNARAHQCPSRAPVGSRRCKLDQGHSGPHATSLQWDQEAGGQ